MFNSYLGNNPIELKGNQLKEEIIMKAKEIRDKALIVLLVNFFIPGLGHILAYKEIAEALRRTGKQSDADPEAIKKKGIIQLVTLVVSWVAAPFTCGFSLFITFGVWVWSFIMDSVVVYYGVMSSVGDDVGSS